MVSVFFPTGTRVCQCQHGRFHADFNDGVKKLWLWNYQQFIQQDDAGLQMLI